MSAQDMMYLDDRKLSSTLITYGCSVNVTQDGEKLRSYLRSIAGP